MNASETPYLPLSCADFVPALGMAALAAVFALTLVTTNNAGRNHGATEAAAVSQQNASGDQKVADRRIYISQLSRSTLR